MSKLDELIQEYCPDGVHHESLGDLCKIETGKLNANAAAENGQYLFFTTAKEISRIDKYRWDTEALLIAGNANVGDVKHYEGKFNAYQRTYVLNDFDQSISVRFLYFFISSALKNYLENRTNSAAMTYIVLSTLQDFKVPVPPLEVQKEIVNILDKFTQLEAGLSIELDARRRQYEYYKSTLLKPSEEVGWKTIGEVCEVGDGNHSSSYPKASEMVDQGVPFIRGTNILDGTISGKDMKYISEEKHIKLKKGHLRANDVLVTNRGEVGKIAIIPEQFANSNLNSQIAWLRADTKTLLPKYLFFIMNANFIQNKIIGEGGALKQLTIKNLKLLKIPVPSIKKQEEIVEVLDNFDTLANDKMVGIPAEIDARSQQYEYYRTKLLTFHELPV